MTLDGLAAAIANQAPVTVSATGAKGTRAFTVSADVSTASERACLVSGGLMHEVLASFVGHGPDAASNVRLELT